MGETSESIWALAEAARDMQRQRFSNNGSSDIVCNADMRIARGRSEPDVDSDESAQFIGASLSSRLEIGENNC